MNKDFISKLNLVSVSNYYSSLHKQHQILFEELYDFKDFGKEIINIIMNKKEDSLLLFRPAIYEQICKKHFAYKIIFKCINDSCNEEFTTSRILKKCPKCRSSLYITNEDKLNNVIEYSLKDYEFYLLGDEKETIYLIYNKKLDTKTIKKGNSNFKDFITFELKGHQINLNYLANLYQGSMESNLLFSYITENNLINVITNLGFEPTTSKFIKRENNIYFNTYNGNEYLNLILSDKDKELLKKFSLENDCPNIYELLFNLVGKNQEGLDYLIKYLSFALNNPNVRTEKVISFFGEEETGKGIFYHHILNVLFKNYCSFITMQEIEDNSFNEYYSSKLFVFIDESSHNKKIENLLLNYTTAKEIIINKKHGTKRAEEVYFNYICASNKEIPMRVGNRRSIYFRSKSLGGNLHNASSIGERLVNNISNEINLFAKFLKSFRVDFITINKGYNNIDKKDVLEATKDIEERFLDEMLSYQNLNDFVNSLINENIGNYLKDDFIEYELFLKCYNKFRFAQGLKTSTTLNKFNWFCNKLNIDKENIEEFKRGFNTDKRKVRWINHSIISKLYLELNPLIEEIEVQGK